MRLRIKYILTSVLIILSPCVSSYELDTHARLTEQAFFQSALSVDDTLIENLGLSSFDVNNPFGDIYYDISGTTINVRNIYTYEKDVMPNKGDDELTIKGWLMRGAIREDDLGMCDPFWKNPYKLSTTNQPYDDDYGDFTRVLHHFYDPVNDEGLNGVIVQAFLIYCGYQTAGTNIHKAPDWALGTLDTFVDGNNLESDRRNHFTIYDARETLWRALTARNKTGNLVASTDAERKAYWATTFRVLGDVIHLVQDMGQSQHTRNDIHPPDSGERTIYEEYINARATGKTSYKIDRTSIIPDPLNYTGYPIPEFDDYASYFSTRHLDGTDPMARRGLADFSNRSFFSAGTNLDDTGYDYPSRIASNYTQGESPVSFTSPSNISTHLLLDNVIDTLNPGHTKFQQPLTTESLWHNWLVGMPVAKYNLVKNNYDAMADMLIPRAVAYSAGLINYFFRGRLEFEATSLSDTQVSIRLRNMADNDDVLYGSVTPGTASKLMMNYEYKDVDGNTVFGTAVTQVSMNEVEAINSKDWSIGPSGGGDYTFTIPNLGTIKTERDFKLRLIFRGRLGNEHDAIAVGVAEMTSPGFIFNPSVTPSDGLNGTRLIYKADGKWQLDPNNGYEAGNIDWKGWYVDGKPTKVLSWMGPPTRYFSLHVLFPNWNIPEPFSNGIYQNGELFSIAPYNIVLGSALTKDTNGNEWIVVICRDFYGDIIFKRPNTLNLSSQLYDPVLAPEGWQLVKAFPPQPNTMKPDTIWAFNGEGKEAQTMRMIDPVGNSSYTDIQLTRLKINITPDIDDASIVDMGNLEGWVQNSFYNAIRDEETSTGSRNESNIQSGEYIIAIDYKDTQEAFCIFNINKNHQDSISVKSGQTMRFKNSTFYTSISCGNTNAILEKDNEIYTVDTTSSGNNTISGIKNVIDHDFGISYIDYADARNDIISTVAAAYSDKRKGVYTSNNGTYINGSCPGNYTANTNSINEAYIEDRVITTNKEIITFHEDIPPHSGASTEYFGILCFPIGGTSSSSSSISYPKFTYINSNSQLIGSWSFDRNGNLFISRMNSAIFHSDGSKGYFNLLIDGNINDLTGTPIDSTNFYPISPY